NQRESHPGLSRNDEPDRAEVLTVLFDCWLHDREAGASAPETFITQCRRPFQGTITHSFSNPVMPGEWLFVQMSLAPAAVPNSGASVRLSFGRWNHYS